MNSSHRLRHLLVPVAAMAIALGGASSAHGSTGPSDEAISLVAIGDSIPYNSPDDCQGCTGFVASYADALEAQIGQRVDWLNRSRHDGAMTADIDQELASGDLDEVLASADIVLISIGFNDQPPYWGPSRPCVADPLETDADVFAAVMATTTECIDDVTLTVRESAASVLGIVRTLAPDAAIGVLTAYDAWTGWDALEAAGPEIADPVSTVIAYALDEWRKALCAEAAVVEAVCVDVYGGFNGPDGRQPSGDLLADDYTHPSQLGNDRIRDLLLESSLFDGSASGPSTTSGE